MGHFRGFLALALLLLAGCGEVRTVTPDLDNPPPRLTSHVDGHASVHASPTAGRRDREIYSPLYSQDVPTVYTALVTVCMGYFGHIDRQDDAAHSLFIKDYCFWMGGTTLTTINVTAPRPGLTMVDFESHAGSPSGMDALGPRERYLIKEVILKLDAALLGPLPGQ